MKILVSVLVDVQKTFFPHKILFYGSLVPRPLPYSGVEWIRRMPDITTKPQTRKGGHNRYYTLSAIQWEGEDKTKHMF